MRDVSEQCVKLQAGIDQNLDKIRTKLLDKYDEAGQLLRKYNIMLELGQDKDSEAQGELTPTQLTSSEKARSKDSNLEKQIEGIERDRQHIDKRTTRLYSSIKKLCQDHYSWLR